MKIVTTGNLYRRSIIPLFFIVLSTSSSLVGAEPLRVGFLCPKAPGQGFWGQVIQVMQSAAEDLDIELQVSCDETESIYGARIAGLELLKSEPKLDYLLTGYWAMVTKYHLALAKERGIKVYLFNADIRDDEKGEFGSLRGHYYNWIGHMVPDDKNAAMTLTKTLVNLAEHGQKKAITNPVTVEAMVSGKELSTVARQRNAGLRAQIKLMPQARLHEFPVDNTAIGEVARVGRSKEWAMKLMSSSRAIDVIWTGNHDEMWGVVQGVEQAGKIPGKDVFIGGFDWNADSIQAIADGRISVSMFGHFMEGAWALLLVHDYHYGFDFAGDVGLKISTPMSAITSENYQRYKTILNEAHWRSVDFKMLSKKHNSTLKSYNFNISQFLDLQ
ncbi:MAG: ABC transporter substrate-binding protein [Gammaproteobacteria bacterium]|nr:ABC transporter substrate-binding protein [Gammaproteobacteria bacterium]